MTDTPDGGAPPGTGPVVLVTGGRGELGRAVVSALRSRGACPVAIDLVVPGEPADGAELDVVADVTRAPDMAGAVDQTLGRFGRIDGLVAAAGVTGPVAPLADVALDEWRQVFEVNVVGVVTAVQAVLPVLLPRRSGHIVTVASGSGLAGTENMACYAASKHAVVGLTRSLAREVAAAGVVVNTVCPGPVESAMMADVEARYAALTGSDTGYRTAMPTGRYVAAAEVAALVAFLACEAPASLTGAAITIDGGLRA